MYVRTTNIYIQVRYTKETRISVQATILCTKSINCTYYVLQCVQFKVCHTNHHTNMHKGNASCQVFSVFCAGMFLWQTVEIQHMHERATETSVPAHDNSTDMSVELPAHIERMYLPYHFNYKSHGGNYSGAIRGRIFQKGCKRGELPIQEGEIHTSRGNVIRRLNSEPDSRTRSSSIQVIV